jgi:hypothetical protein
VYLQTLLGGAAFISVNISGKSEASLEGDHVMVNQVKTRYLLGFIPMLGIRTGMKIPRESGQLPRVSLSASARARIAKAQRARWANVRAAKQNA